MSDDFLDTDENAALEDADDQNQFNDSSILIKNIRLLKALGIMMNTMVTVVQKL